MVELSFGDLLSETFSEYKKHLGLFAKILVLLYLLPNAVITIVIYSIIMALGLQPEMLEGLFLGNISPEAIIGLGVGAGVFILSIVTSMLLYALMYIAVIRIIALRRTKQELSFGEVLSQSLKYLPAYIGLSIVMVFGLGGLFLLFIIPGIIFSVYWTFAAFALVSDNKGVFESLSESKRLVQGRWWTVLGYTLLIGLIIGGIGFGVGMALLIPSVILNLIPFIGPILSQIMNDAVGMFLIPFSVVFLELFYQKLKEPEKQETAEKAIPEALTHE